MALAEPEEILMITHTCIRNQSKAKAKDFFPRGKCSICRPTVGTFCPRISFLPILPIIDSHGQVISNSAACCWLRILIQFAARAGCGDIWSG